MKERIPLPFQKKAIYKLERVMKGRGLLSFDMGLGKAQPLDSKVLTPSGWVRIGNIKIGDYVVGVNGSRSKVTGIHPQGWERVYSVHTRDGGVAECTESHLWDTNTATRNMRGSPHKTKTLKEIKQTLKEKNGNCKHYLPLNQAVLFKQKGELRLNPYLMGYLIANGHLKSMSISVTIPDKETVERLKKRLPEKTVIHTNDEERMGYRIVRTGRENKVRTEIKRMKLQVLSYDKFIPPEYRFATITDRVQLLQGLMDGDGSVGKKDNHLEYTSSSYKLARHVKELVFSLGGVARIHEKEDVWFTYKGERKQGARHWRVSIALPDDVLPFQLSRKADVYTKRTKYKPSRAITDIKYVGKKECQCITIDSKDGLYITNDYIVTHNSFTSLANRKKFGPFKRPTIVVCFAGLKLNWQDECRLAGMGPVVILDGRTPPKKLPTRAARKSKTVYIINYDIIPWWVEWLKGLDPGCVIIDESQAIKNEKSKRFKAVRKICKGVKKVLALTGTPIVNTAIDLWPTLNILKPSRYRSRSMFGAEYCKVKHTHWGPKFEGAKNEDKLHEELQDVMIRVLRKDVLKDLPDETRNVIPVELSAKNMKAYKRASDDYVRWLTNTSPHLAPNARSMIRQSKQMGLKRLAAELRLDAVHEWIDLFLEDTDEKLLVFGWHVSYLEGLHEKYKDISVLINGKTKAAEKHARIAKFQTKKKCRIIFGNLIAAGVGTNLTAANHTFFAEMGWTPKDHTQAVARMQRIGQKAKKLSSYYMAAKGTIEEYLFELNERKQGYSDRVIDGLKGGSTFDVHTALDKMIRSKTKLTMKGKR